MEMGDRDNIVQRRTRRRVRPAAWLVRRDVRIGRHADSLRAIHAQVAGPGAIGDTLNVILDELTSRLRVDAATVLLIDGGLRTAASRGFDDGARPSPDGPLARAALGGAICWVPSLSSVSDPRARALCAEGFRSYAAVPLMARGRPAGVLELLHRRSFDPDSGWMDLLEALVGQTAIALDNAMLSDALKRANEELGRAYDATLEGWARALDLRDKETEGHCRRVADLAVRLATQLGIGGQDLLDLRRGALLHDIGKMAVPDAILLKPGPLTDDEWMLMREHPRFAFEMLAPIPFLAGALAIPYCHHERWDGTGYPNRLRGEEIPAAARIFAVADLWDALGSRRVYREAWPVERVRGHIRGLSGTHLEPRVVEAFLDLRPHGTLP